MSYIDKIKISNVNYDIRDTLTKKEVSDLVKTVESLENVSIVEFTYGECISIPSNGSSVNLSVPTVNANYCYGICECSEGDTFIINGSSNAGNKKLWSFADSENIILSQSASGLTANDLVLTAPANSAYIIINALVSSSSKVCVKGTPLEVVVERQESSIIACEERVAGLYQYYQPLNLFDKDSENNLKNEYYDGTTLKTSTTLGQSELIQVKGDGYYSQSLTTTFVLWYKSDQSYGGKLASNGTGHFKMPSSAYYARFMFRVADISTTYVYETDSDYVPYKSPDSPFLFPIQEVIDARNDESTLKDRIDSVEAKAEGNSAYYGLSGVAFGTSLTYRAVPASTGGYLRKLPELSGITFDNQGLGNSTIVSRSDRPEMMPKITGYTGFSDKRIVILEGYVNDWGSGNPLGAYTDTEVTTVCGAVRYAIDYVLTQNPNVTIFLVLDHYGKPGGGASCASTRQNANGLTQYEFYEEIAKVGESMGIHVIKLYAESGISERTPQYIRDNIHPTDPLGVEQTAQTIWAGMKKWLPNVIEE